MSDEPQVVNITAAFSYGRDHYLGVTMHDGVTFDLIEAPCGEGRQLVSFGNTEQPPTGIFWDTVSAVTIDDEPVRHYLELYPAD